MDLQKIGLPAETSSPSLGEQTAALRRNFEPLPMDSGILDINFSDSLKDSAMHDPAR